MATMTCVPVCLSEGGAVLSFRDTITDSLSLSLAPTKTHTRNESSLTWGHGGYFGLEPFEVGSHTMKCVCSELCYTEFSTKFDC